VIKAKGNIVSRNQMRRAHQGLKEESHLERQISQMPTAILGLIEPQPRRGYRIEWVQA
jgi:hypothetical protein